MFETNPINQPKTIFGGGDKTKEVFTPQAVDLFVKGLAEYGGISPVYDFTDTQTAQLYKELLKNTKPAVESRDTTSWKEITDAVYAARQKYGDGGLIIIRGAGCHIWGAVTELEKTCAARYLPLASRKIKVGDAVYDGFYGDGKIGTDEISVQMKRDIGAMKYLGYKDIESFIKEREKNKTPKNLVIGLEETGFHGLYDETVKAPVYEKLKKLIAQTKPKYVLYIGEDLYAETMKSYLEKGYQEIDNCFDRFLKHVKYDLKIPVEVGAFGWEDRKNDKRKSIFPLDPQNPDPFREP